MRIRFRARQCIRPAHAMNRAQSAIAAIASSRVSRKYSVLPTALAYGTAAMSAISSIVTGLIDLERCNPSSAGVVTGLASERLNSERISSTYSVWSMMRVPDFLVMRMFSIHFTSPM